MSARVDIVLGLKDLLTGAVRKTEMNTRGALGGITKNADAAINKTDQLFNAAQKMGSGFARSGRDAANSLRGVGVAADSALQKVSRLGDQMNVGSASLGKIAGGSFLGNIAAMGVTSAAGGVMRTGMDMLNKGMAKGAMQEQFKVLAGDEEGLRLFSDLKKYVADSVFGPELYGNARTMLAFGIPAKEVMADMKMLGDVAMGNKETMDLLTLAFAQTASTGKLMGDDLRQYVTSGFNPLMVLADKTGRKYEDLKEQMSAGKVSAKMVRDAFVIATSEGGRYYKMLEKVGKTPGGKYQAMQGSLEDMKTDMGEVMSVSFGRLLEQIKPDIDALPDKVGQVMAGIVPGVEALSKSLLGIMKPIGAVFLSKEFADMTSGTLKLATAIADVLQPAVKELSKELTTAMGSVSDLLGVVTGKSGGIVTGNNNPFFEWTSDKNERMKREQRELNGTPWIKKDVPFFAWTSDANKRRSEEKKLNIWAPGWSTGGALTQKEQNDLGNIAGSVFKGKQAAAVTAQAAGSVVPGSVAAAPDTSAKRDAITGGGKKVINIYLNQPLVKEQVFHVGSMQEAMAVGLNEFREQYLRVLQGANAAL